MLISQCETPASIILCSVMHSLAKFLWQAFQKKQKNNTKKTQKKQMVTSPTDKTRVKWMNSSTSLFIDGQK